ncbi:TetR/AcrR family transcriptional regulator [Methylogaea oryzae]|uniref:Transcriptional regulator n=1 Tax=Methylogaea oryzae TaxID=1295382 RepID=A0A8D4VUH3_9GAMM|nr:TetR/AcrR family transcriptional regulator [Methylogaea oryzae]BBL72709.1 transcriptional regulator [Methylogaea oryzae]
MSTVPTPKRAAILDAAKRVFIAHGYSGASMEAIAEAAPVSKPTLYSHFKGKQELFAAVVAGQCEALLGTLSRAQAEQPDALSGLKAVARSFVDLVYAEEALSLYRMIVAEQPKFPDLGTLVYRASADPILHRLSSYLTELHESGALRIPDVATSSRLLTSMLKGDEHFRCLMGLQPALSEAEKERLVDAAVDLFLKGHGYAA